MWGGWGIHLAPEIVTQESLHTHRPMRVISLMCVGDSTIQRNFRLTQNSYQFHNTRVIHVLSLSLTLLHSCIYHEVFSALSSLMCSNYIRAGVWVPFMWCPLCCVRTGRGFLLGGGRRREASWRGQLAQAGKPGNWNLLYLLPPPDFQYLETVSSFCWESSSANKVAAAVRSRRREEEHWKRGRRASERLWAGTMTFCRVWRGISWWCHPQ